jgi:hypothetical protein
LSLGPRDLAIGNSLLRSDLSQIGQRIGRHSTRGGGRNHDFAGHLPHLPHLPHLQHLPRRASACRLDHKAKSLLRLRLQGHPRS